MNLISKQATFQNTAPSLKQICKKMRLIGGFKVRIQQLDPTSSQWQWRARVYFLDDHHQRLTMGYQIQNTHALPQTNSHTIYFEAPEGCEPVLSQVAELALQEMGGMLNSPMADEERQTLKRSCQKQPYALRLLKAKGISPVVWISALILLPLSLPKWLYTKALRCINHYLRVNTLLFRY